MIISEAIKEIIKLKGFLVFDNYKMFIAMLADFSTDTNKKELDIFRKAVDEKILKICSDNTLRDNNKIAKIRMKLEDYGFSDKTIEFIVESFALALGWNYKKNIINQQQFQQPKQTQQAKQQVKQSKQTKIIQQTKHQVQQTNLYNRTIGKNISRTPLFGSNNISNFVPTDNLGIRIDSNICVGCGSCESVCPVDAIKVIGTVARVDKNECIECGACVDECPADAISQVQQTNLYNRTIGKNISRTPLFGSNNISNFVPTDNLGIRIDSNICVGCGSCESVCPVDAIKVIGTVARVDKNECIECGACVDECPADAISLE